MSAKGVSVLADELGGQVPDGLQALTDAQLRSFAEAVREAKQRQSEELEAAIGQSLEIVPRVCRRPVRKILFG